MPLTAIRDEHFFDLFVAYLEFKILPLTYKALNDPISLLLWARSPL